MPLKANLDVKFEDHFTRPFSLTTSVVFPPDVVTKAFALVLKRIRKKTGQTDEQIRASASDGLHNLALEEITSWIERNWKPQRPVYTVELEHPRLQEGREFPVTLRAEVLPEIANFYWKVDASGSDDDIISRLVASNPIPILPTLLKSRVEKWELLKVHTIHQANAHRGQDYETAKVAPGEKLATESYESRKIKEEIVVSGFEQYCPLFKPKDAGSFDELISQVANFIRAHT